MTPTILIGKAGSTISPALLDKMFRLRAAVFRDRLGWAVQVADGRESDWYDALAPYYVVATDSTRSICLGCCRLLPTTGPNMLRDIFSPLLRCDGAVPANPCAWEVSRFAVDTAAVAGQRYGFGEVSAAMIREMVRFVVDAKASTLVGVTTTAFARLMDGIGFDVHQLGVTTQIGNARTMAFVLPLTTNVQNRLGVDTRSTALEAA